MPLPIIAAIAPADADEGGLRDHVANRGEWARKLSGRQNDSGVPAFAHNAERIGVAGKKRGSLRPDGGAGLYASGPDPQQKDYDYAAKTPPPTSVF